MTVSFKITPPPRKIFYFPPSRIILDPRPSVDMVLSVLYMILPYIYRILYVSIVSLID